MNDRKFRTTVLALLAVMPAACDKDKDKDKDEGAKQAEGEAVASEQSGAEADGAGSEDDDREARRAARKAAKASFAEHAKAWEALVVSNDVDAIQAMWVSPDALSGCVTKEQELVDGKMARVDTDETWAEQVARTRESFDDELTLLAELDHGETFRHRTPVWANRGINEAFGGADCSLEFHGEVWFDALVKDRPKTDGVRHRAYFALVDDAWKLLRINGPDTVKCDNPADRAHEVCKKLRGEEVEP